MNRNSVHKNDIKSQEKKYPVLLNRTRVIATAEDKANITGFRWTLPQTMPPGFVEKRNAKGKFLYYVLTEPVTIQDVDGKAKHTIKKSFYEADQQTLKDTPKPAFGERIDGLAGAYHGKLSRHWTQDHQNLQAIIDNLNSGFAIAPGLLDGLPDVVNESLGDRQHILIFLPTVEASIEATQILSDAGIKTSCVLGITSADERKQTLSDFQDGKIRVLVNCQVLTEGFDCPCIDALIVARPTKSGLLIQQMVGRGLRKAPGKKDCIIVDLAFQRRQQDLISVAASGIFGGFQDLEFSRQDMSILELIEFQKERVPLMQGLHSVLSQRLAKLETEQENEIETDVANEEMTEYEAPYIDPNVVSEGVMLLIDTALLRRICGENVDVGACWKRLTQALARTPYYMRTKPATEKQKSLLASKFDLDWDDLDMLNCADAAAMIGTFLAFEQPTIKQLRWLEWKGVPDASMPETKATAIKMISDLSARGVSTCMKSP